MQGLLISLFGALAGSMLFFAFAVAPTVFRSLPAEHAGPFLRACALSLRSASPRLLPLR